MNMRRYSVVVLLLIAMLAIGAFIVAQRLAVSPETASDQRIQTIRAKYLGDPQTPEAMKAAIKAGVVVAGMCPHQAFAAAGYPGPYMVRADRTVWSDGVPPPIIVDAQCEAPDASVIELTFRNATQFKAAGLSVFRVRFENGKAVHIERSIPTGQ